MITKCLSDIWPPRDIYNLWNICLGHPTQFGCICQTRHWATQLSLDVFVRHLAHSPFWMYLSDIWTPSPVWMYLSDIWTPNPANNGYVSQTYHNQGVSLAGDIQIMTILPFTISYLDLSCNKT